MRDLIYDIDVTFSEDESFDVTFESDATFEVDFGSSEGVSGEEYQGAYEVTPSGTVQTLSTKDKVLTQNVKINPIPSNYGLITWNGSVLTVS